ncbi:MAG: SEL1-like repeat protein [Hyphomicrobiales bacterium]|nr:SEL1-like repeat protein [Hyphomicrobiales bacterium]
MSKAVPWSIKGVDRDARERAREAAEREGKSVAAWLEEVISERATGHEERAPSSAERIRRLAVSRPQPVYEDDIDDDFDERPRRSSRLRFAEEAEAEAEARADAVFDIQRIEKRLESNVENTARTRGALNAIMRRLGDIEERVTQKDDAAPYRAIRGALGRLEERIDGIAERAEARDDFGLGEIDRKLSELSASLEQTAARASQNQAEEGRIDRIEQALSALSSQLETRAAPPPVDPRLGRIEEQLSSIASKISSAPPVAPPPAPEALTLQDIERRMVERRASARMSETGLRRPLVDALSQISLRQRELDGPDAAPAPYIAPLDMRRAPSDELENRLSAVLERIETRLSAPPPAPPPPAPPPPAPAPEPVVPASVQNDLKRMSQHLDSLRTEMASQDQQPLDTIRRDLEQVVSRLDGLAPRASIASLEGALHDISRRLEAAQPAAQIDGVRHDMRASIDDLSRDLHASLASLDQRDSIDSLGRNMRALAEKVDRLTERDGVDPVTVDAIHRQTREVRDLLAQAAAMSQPAERAQRELAQLSQNISAGRSDISHEDLERLTADVRAIVKESASPKNLETIEQRLVQLTQRVDRALLASTDNPQIAAVNERLDTIHRAMAQTMAAPARGPDVSAIERMLGELARKIDNAQAPTAGGAELVALQTQIEKLSQKIDHAPTARGEQVAQLEKMMGELFGHLEDVRREAVEAARDAAREGARTAVAPQVSEDIAQLRANQDASDKRTHATLSAVHQTLERVVDRLSTLETDITATRRAAPAAAVAAAPAVAAPAPAAPRIEAPMPPLRPVAAAPAPRAPIDDELIEPNTPRIDPRKLAARVRAPVAAAPAAAAADKTAQASFIAAARRAAYAAKSAASDAERAEADAEPIAAVSRGGAALAQLKRLEVIRSRPILLAMAATVMAVASLYIAGSTMGGREAPAPAQVSSGPAAAPRDVRRVDVAPPADAQAAPSLPNAARSPDVAPAPPAEAAPSKAESAPETTPAAPAPVAPQKKAELGAPNIDPAPTGTAAANPSIQHTRPLAMVQQAAAKGDALAQFELGVRYAEGNQAPRDAKLSAEWFAKSASKGLAPAQYRLGVIYERGTGVPRDTNEARKWYERAAESGNVRAMHNLAVLAADGGGKPDYVAAMNWFRKAAEFGVRDSQFNLAILYARGMGGAQDLVQSYVWFAAAAAQGDEDAGKKRDEVAARMDAKSLARARAIAEAFHARTPVASANEIALPLSQPRTPIMTRAPQPSGV